MAVSLGGVAYAGVAVAAVILFAIGKPADRPAPLASPPLAPSPVVSSPVVSSAAVASGAVVSVGPSTAASAASAPAASPAPASTPAPAAAPAAPSWAVPDIDKLPDDRWGRTVRRGRDLTAATYKYIGPEVADATSRYAGNNLSCQNCHLEGAAKQFGLPFVGVFADFPQYGARGGAVATIEDRVNGCMTRSMNGRPLPLGSPEMIAFVSFIKFMSDGVPVGARTRGRGSGKMPELNRAADPVHGKQVFAENCAACHGADGQGKRRGVMGDAQGYEFPPLWGPDSYNDGAGMGRLIAAANFVHSNMPKGTSWQAPVLSAADAWDVAAFVVSQPRPHKADLDKDFPDRLQKPVDAGYGPYADGFDLAQHKYGPFAPIRAKLKELRSRHVSD